MEEIYPKMQLVKKDTDPSSKQLVHAAERGIRTLRAFFAIRKKVFEETSTEKTMNDIINTLNSKQDLHAEL